MKLVAATGNAHKLQEIRAILQGSTVLSEKEAGYFGDVEETGETFLENALLKARAVCKATGLPAIADDSGICVEALSGAPGVHSARYASQDGKNSSDESNRAPFSFAICKGSKTAAHGSRAPSPSSFPTAAK